ncbi:MAG: hypothetical protein ACLQVD_13335 [Capsulimonadaceae bacterium]
MKRIIASLAAAGCMLAAMNAGTVPAVAAKAAIMKCPACGMKMSTTKTAMMTVPVKVNGKTYYCCPMCKSGKSAMHMKKKAM